ncbi:TonB family protein [Tenacibaculum adriaticum]|uniref:TonB family protein n=1 Tax=Tenacibaculum adriaticum TaxID=413713 RepID=A0A5S5DZM9_9FLAO|nr:M56 family metallopeptidase [Tenacibaculum adriaticum]TYQ00467.1 TonB family protein [Tenacibaculum adriaticum]
MINYIIQVLFFQVLFVAVYDFFLSKETFFTKNRFYLLSTAIVSFVLPLLKIPTIQKAVPEEYTILLSEVVLSPQKVIEKAAWYQSINYLDILFWIGCILFFIVFLFKLERIIRLILKYEIIQKKDYKLVLLPKNSKAFSFFNFIFIGKEIPEEKKEKIIQHELVHSKQKHTLDLLFFEFLKIVMWFNPMVYVYQNRISLVHEFISDEVVTKSTEKSNYINNLLSEIFQVEHISFINQFYKHSLIKKRILMMTKTKSKQIKQLKYLLLVPVLASMLLYTACLEKNSNDLEPTSLRQKLYNDLEKEPKVMSKESFFDVYINKELPKTKELSVSDLSTVEEEEFLQIKERLIKGTNIQLKIFEGLEGRKLIVVVPPITDGNSIKEGDNVPFGFLEKAPAFPNQGEGKDAFNKNMAQFVKENFDAKSANNLGLPSGKKRVYVQFKIDKEGNVTDVNVRAPHPELEVAAKQMIAKLPQLIPGEHNGKKVKVGYTLPITFNVE